MTSLALPLICPEFIGRATERVALLDLLERARGGTGQCALVSGEAGIGKSRLIAEVSAEAARLGVLHLEGRCYQSDSALPYAPLLDLFRAYAARHPLESGALADSLARLLPELAPNPPAPPPDRADRAEDKRQVFAALTRFVTEQAAQRPVLLVIEDIHWCDDLSLEWLLQLARRRHALPVLLLVSLRTEEAPPAPRQWLAQLNRERLAHEFALAPFTREEVANLARALLPADRAASDELLDMLATRSEGNPFFAEELLRTLAVAGALAHEAGEWRRSERQAPLPRSVREMVRQQTERVSAAGRRALDVAAVAGRQVDFRLLRAVLGHEDEPLLALLKELIAAHLLIEESADRFAFRHALIREAVYGELLARERGALHRAIAGAIATLWPEGPLREAHLPDLAAHYFAGGEWASALAYAERAAAHALELHAPHAALEHVARASEAAERLGRPRPATVELLRGQAHEALGEFDPARQSYECTLALARAAAERTLEWRCLLALGFLWAARDYGQAGEWFRQALDLAEHANDAALRAHSLNRYGNWLANIGRIAESLRAHRDALRLFEALDDAPGRAAALDLLGIAQGNAGDRIAATACLSQAITLFEAQGDLRSLCSSLAMRAIQSNPGASETTYCPLRPRDACIGDATEALRLARQTGSLSAQTFAANALARTHLSFGEYGPALAHMRAAARHAAEIEHQQWLVATTCGLGLIYADLSALDDAIAALEAGLAQAHTLGSEFWVASIAAHLGQLRAQQGDLSAAAAVLRSVLPADQPPLTIAERGVALAWGRVLLAQGEPERALVIADQLLATVPGEAPAGAPQPIPRVLMLRGEALLALTQGDDAITALEAARLGAEQRYARPLLWTIQRALGRAFRHQRRYEAARRAEAAARALVGELGSTLDDAPLRERYERGALATLPAERPVRPAQAAKQAFSGLTAREREVAVLIARGATSREIARALVISERTAEAHVGHMLSKLGFASRSQIAAWAVASGLAGA